METAVASARQSTSAPGKSQEPKSLRARKIAFTVLLIAALGVGGFVAWQKFGSAHAGGAIFGTPFATQRVNGLAVTLIHPRGQLVSAGNDILIEFRDDGGQLADVGAVKFALDMSMPGMVRHEAATVKPTDTPGRYRASVKPGMVGDWMVKLDYDGSHGKGEITFSVSVKP